MIGYSFEHDLYPHLDSKIIKKEDNLLRFRLTRHHLCQAVRKSFLQGIPMNQQIHVKNYESLHHSFLPGQIVHGRTL